MEKTNNYTALRKKQQQDFNSFPCFFAFNQSQFDEGMRKLGVVSEKELYKGVGGMFYRKVDAGKLHALMNRLDTEMKEAFKNDDFLRDAITCEFKNHEYCITLDDEETLDALGLTQEEILEDERMSAIWIKAREDYLNNAVC